MAENYEVITLSSSDEDSDPQVILPSTASSSTSSVTTKIKSEVGNAKVSDSRIVIPAYSVSANSKLQVLDVTKSSLKKNHLNENLVKPPGPSFNGSYGKTLTDNKNPSFKGPVQNTICKRSAPASHSNFTQKVNSISSTETRDSRTVTSVINKNNVTSQSSQSKNLDAISLKLLNRNKSNTCQKSVKKINARSENSNVSKASSENSNVSKASSRNSNLSKASSENSNASKASSENSNASKASSNPVSSKSIPSVHHQRDFSKPEVGSSDASVPNRHSITKVSGNPKNNVTKNFQTLPHALLDTLKKGGISVVNVGKNQESNACGSRKKETVTSSKIGTLESKDGSHKLIHSSKDKNSSSITYSLADSVSIKSSSVKETNSNKNLLDSLLLKHEINSSCHSLSQLGQVEIIRKDPNKKQSTIKPTSSFMLVNATKSKNDELFSAKSESKTVIPLPYKKLEFSTITSNSSKSNEKDCKPKDQAFEKNTSSNLPKVILLNSTENRAEISSDRKGCNLVGKSSIPSSEQSNSDLIRDLEEKSDIKNISDVKSGLKSTKHSTDSSSIDVEMLDLSSKKIESKIPDTFSSERKANPVHNLDFKLEDPCNKSLVTNKMDEVERSSDAGEKLMDRNSEMLLEYCASVMKETEEEKAKIMKKICHRFESTQVEYLSSYEFSALVKTTKKDIEKNSESLFIPLNCLVQELKAHKRRKSSEPKAIQIEDASRESVSTKDSVSSHLAVKGNNVQTILDSVESDDFSLSNAFVNFSNSASCLDASNSSDFFNISALPVVSDSSPMSVWPETSCSYSARAMSKISSSCGAPDLMNSSNFPSSSELKSSVSSGEVPSLSSELNDLLFACKDHAKNVYNEKYSKTPFCVQDDRAKNSKERLEKHAERLEKLLEKYDREIKKLQQRELSLEDLDEEDSTYLLEDRYKRKFMKIWAELCKVKKRSVLAGRQMERRFCYEGTRFTSINLAIERKINKQKSTEKFPNYIEILAIVKDVNDRENLGLNEGYVTDLAKNVFKDVGCELKKRRQYDDEELLNGYLPENFNLNEDPAEQDQALRTKLEESAELGSKRIAQVIDEYAEKQHLLPEDGEENMDVGEDDDDSEEDGDNLDEAEHFIEDEDIQKEDKPVEEEKNYFSQKKESSADVEKDDDFMESKGKKDTIVEKKEDTSLRTTADKCVKEVIESDDLPVTDCDSKSSEDIVILSKVSGVKSDDTHDSCPPTPEFPLLEAASTLEKSSKPSEDIILSKVPEMKNEHTQDLSPPTPEVPVPEAESTLENSKNLNPILIDGTDYICEDVISIGSDNDDSSELPSLSELLRKNS
ncbi:uncharacterized protein LOC129224977 [Uloborus diversus]|uniref:uncharacterized protein LOC129224977 n=1 Tax=Uloborus diversus TaxID=327109 RepID=UPI00240A1EA6|nr:uncharacterized protein LOC129224977 [Uloborus diversus]